MEMKVHASDKRILRFALMLRETDISSPGAAACVDVPGPGWRPSGTSSFNDDTLYARGRKENHPNLLLCGESVL